MQVFITKSYWSCSRLLVFATLSMLGLHSNSSWLFCCCRVLWRSCSFGSSGPVPSCAPVDHRWSGCWGRPIHNCCSESGCLQAWSTHQVFLFLTWVSSPALPWLAPPVQPAARNMTSSPALRSSDSGHPHSHYQGQLYILHRQGTETMSECMAALWKTYSLSPYSL